MSEPNSRLVKRTIPARRLAHGAPAPHLSATVDLPIMGYLSVEVTFLGEPVADLKVEFYRSDGSLVPNLASLMFPGSGFTSDKTDAIGRCAIPFPVPVDTYTCKIDRQDAARITTVEALDRPFVIVLPVGRPYFDSYEQYAPHAVKLSALRKEKL